MAELRKDLEALQIALQTEEDGYKLYRGAVDSGTHPLSKSIFEQLAKDELLHTALIKKFYAHLKVSKSWTALSDEDKNFDKSKQKYKTIFSEALLDAQKGQLKMDDVDLDVYQKAVTFEKKGMEMYDRLYNESKDAQAKKFYAFLREMEREHLELLDNTLQYLKNPDNYYLLQEGWSMED